MQTFLKSYAKINITLRVTKLRDDGYHDLCSLFLRVDRGEMLAVSTCDVDNVSSAGVKIDGENIVSKAIRMAREWGFAVPPLDVKIQKTIPPGMGMGGGSGNAGAILNFILEGGNAPRKNFSFEKIAKNIGADVPFFVSNFETAIVSGMGEKIEQFPTIPIKAVISFPKINSPTKGAYEALDAYWQKKYPRDEKQAREEIFEISERLKAREKIGMLPNDFAPLLLRQSDVYEKFFCEADAKNALAWGITGSGAAMFALFPV